MITSATKHIHTITRNTVYMSITATILTQPLLPHHSSSQSLRSQHAGDLVTNLVQGVLTLHQARGYHTSHKASLPLGQY